MAPATSTTAGRQWALPTRPRRTPTTQTSTPSVSFQDPFVHHAFRSKNDPRRRGTNQRSRRNVGSATLPNGDAHAVQLIPCDEHQLGVEGRDYSLVDAPAIVPQTRHAVRDASGRALPAPRIWQRPFGRHSMPWSRGLGAESLKGYKQLIRRAPSWRESHASRKYERPYRHTMERTGQPHS